MTTYQITEEEREAIEMLAGFAGKIALEYDRGYKISLTIQSDGWKEHYERMAMIGKLFSTHWSDEAMGKRELDDNGDGH